jgi:zinc D-Ala-D-Ala dipeptidase
MTDILAHKSRRDLLLFLALSPLAACRAPEREAQPGKERVPAKVKAPAALVELSKLDPAIHFDLRYATVNNFTGRILYSQARAFLAAAAAEALLRAHKRAQADRYGFTVFDAYRPWRVTKQLWDATPVGPKRDYVANPKTGSRHNRGCAVDMSMYNLADGTLVEMPTGFDDFSEKAHRDYQGASAAAIANRERLEAYMTAEGFRGMSNEWWHFDFIGWEKYPVLDIPFEKM